MRHILPQNVCGALCDLWPSARYSLDLLLNSKASNITAEGKLPYMIYVPKVCGRRQ